MKALRVAPKAPGSASLDDVAEPPAEDGALLVEMVAIGVCGTDREILEGLYGAAPAGSGFSRGDCVVPIVRRPD
ncbi:MAG: theronine dehydrogenase, partial [Elusimicrobia bacterium]|nr:theronine dehydrogenase [Elusimicrobiota bacterium]